MTIALKSITGRSLTSTQGLLFYHEPNENIYDAISLFLRCCDLPIYRLPEKLTALTNKCKFRYIA